MAAGALGAAGAAWAQQSAELSVTVAVVRSCTVTDGVPDCGSTAGAATKAGVSSMQPLPRTTIRASPPAREPDPAAAPSRPEIPTIVTIQF